MFSKFTSMNVFKTLSNLGKASISTESQTFASAVQGRRTIYAIDKNIKVSDQRLQEIVEYAVKHTPTSFNSQTGRALLLLGNHHDTFWNNTKEILKGIVPPEQFAPTEKKMNGFQSGYGTVLFFEEQKAVEKLQEQFPLYASGFPTFSQHSSAILQYIMWTSLHTEGLGASLQHYSPLVDEFVQKEWNVSPTWKMVAQMPFGNIVKQAGAKEFQAIEERVKVHK